MIIDHFNLNHLRVFECVFRMRSMTEAARELHLTQSGVSQHIKSLEEVLDVRLFDRVKQRLIPTAAATQLFKRCTEALYGIEQTLGEIREGKQHVSGTVSIGMPIEFGNNMVVPLLAKFGQAHPQVRFNLRYGFPNEMNEAILRGDLDFAFVDAFGLDKRITTEKVYDELLHLCCTLDYLETATGKKGKPGAAAKGDRKFFESLRYVDYQAGEPVLRMWFEHHLGSRNLTLETCATVMDVQGVARFILSHAGAGVLPGHLVGTLEASGKRLHKFKGSGKELKNGISVAYLQERTPTPASAAVFKDLLAAFGPGAPAS
jgi:DNA-binding transcriptional LysR family regulator